MANNITDNSGYRPWIRLSDEAKTVSGNQQMDRGQTTVLDLLALNGKKYGTVFPSGKVSLEDFSHSEKRVDRRRVNVIRMGHKGVRFMLYLIPLSYTC